MDYGLLDPYNDYWLDPGSGYDYSNDYYDYGGSSYDLSPLAGNYFDPGYYENLSPIQGNYDLTPIAPIDQSQYQDVYGYVPYDPWADPMLELNPVGELPTEPIQTAPELQNTAVNLPTAPRSTVDLSPIPAGTSPTIAGGGTSQSLWSKISDALGLSSAPGSGGAPGAQVNPYSTPARPYDAVAAAKQSLIPGVDNTTLIISAVGLGAVFMMQGKK